MLEPASLSNPFLQSSRVRRDALSSLLESSEKPTTSADSIVGEAFNLKGSTNDVLAITANIANNGGSYNPDDKTDYSTNVQQDPVGTWNNFETYGKAALNVAKALGVPGFILGAVEGAAKQEIANTFNDFISAYVTPLGGITPDKTSVLEAAARGAVPFVDLTSTDADSMINLMNQFGTTDAAVGYFSAGTDPVLGSVVEGMLAGADLSKLTPAEYGNVANLVANDYQGFIAKGMDRDAAAKALEAKYLPAPEPEVKVTPVPEPAPVVATPLPPAPSPTTPSGMLSPSPDVVVTPVPDPGPVMGNVLPSILSPNWSFPSNFSIDSDALAKAVAELNAKNEASAAALAAKEAAAKTAAKTSTTSGSTRNSNLSVDDTSLGVVSSPVSDYGSVTGNALGSLTSDFGGYGYGGGYTGVY